TGRKQSLKTKQKRSESMKGRKITWGFKISEAQRGHVVSAETRVKISKANKGRIKSEEEDLKWKKLHENQKGRSLTEEHKYNISEGLKRMWANGGRI
ncbi:MAG: NUMOD3 domain-containing DNA-binding protein, partial [Thaumarchaeota archaeon]|nr:NUMOD3 domain-containing DNA-binding protein [Nitrososphaerota archaeon]